MRTGLALGTVLLAVCGLVGSLLLPWYGVAPATVEVGEWQRFVALLERQRSLAETVRGWSAPNAAGPLLILAAALAVAGVVAVGSAVGRALLAISSVGALALCAFALLQVPGGGHELRIGALVSLACALLLLSAAHRASEI